MTTTNTTNPSKYKGFPLFHDTERVALRTWNRCATFFNILDRHGKPLAQEYAEQFSKGERLQMMMMYNYIVNKGYDTVKAEVNRGEHDDMERIH